MPILLGGIRGPGRGGGGGGAGVSFVLLRGAQNTWPDAEPYFQKSFGLDDDENVYVSHETGNPASGTAGEFLNVPGLGTSVITHNGIARRYRGLFPASPRAEFTAVYAPGATITYTAGGNSIDARYRGVFPFDPLADNQANDVALLDTGQFRQFTPGNEAESDASAYADNAQITDINGGVYRWRTATSLATGSNWDALPPNIYYNAAEGIIKRITSATPTTQNDAPIDPTTIWGDNWLGYFDSRDSALESTDTPAVGNIYYNTTTNSLLRLTAYTPAQPDVWMDIDASVLFSNTFIGIFDTESDAAASVVAARNVYVAVSQTIYEITNLLGTQPDSPEVHDFFADYGGQFQIYNQGALTWNDVADGRIFRQGSVDYRYQGEHLNLAAIEALTGKAVDDFYYGTADDSFYKAIVGRFTAETTAVPVLTNFVGSDGVTRRYRGAFDTDVLLPTDPQLHDFFFSINDEDFTAFVDAGAPTLTWTTKQHNTVIGSHPSFGSYSWIGEFANFSEINISSHSVSSLWWDTTRQGLYGISALATATFTEVTDGTIISGDTYRGSRASDDSVPSPQDGNWYWNTNSNVFRQRSGATWNTVNANDLVNNEYLGNFDTEAAALNDVNAANDWYVIVADVFYQISNYASSGYQSSAELQWAEVGIDFIGVDPNPSTIVAGDVNRYAIRNNDLEQLTAFTPGQTVIALTEVAQGTTFDGNLTTFANVPTFTEFTVGGVTYRFRGTTAGSVALPRVGDFFWNSTEDRFDGYIGVEGDITWTEVAQNTTFTGHDQWDTIAGTTRPRFNLPDGSSYRWISTRGGANGTEAEGDFWYEVQTFDDAGFAAGNFYKWESGASVLVEDPADVFGAGVFHGVYATFADAIAAGSPSAGAGASYAIIERQRNILTHAAGRTYRWRHEHNATQLITSGEAQVGDVFYHPNDGNFYVVNVISGTTITDAEISGYGIFGPDWTSIYSDEAGATAAEATGNGSYAVFEDTDNLYLASATITTTLTEDIDPASYIGSDWLDVYANEAATRLAVTASGQYVVFGDNMYEVTITPTTFRWRHENAINALLANGDVQIGDLFWNTNGTPHRFSALDSLNTTVDIAPKEAFGDLYAGLFATAQLAQAAVSIGQYAVVGSDLFLASQGTSIVQSPSHPDAVIFNNDYLGNYADEDAALNDDANPAAQNKYATWGDVLYEITGVPVAADVDVVAESDPATFFGTDFMGIDPARVFVDADISKVAIRSDTLQSLDAIAPPVLSDVLPSELFPGTFLGLVNAVADVYMTAGAAVGAKFIVRPDSTFFGNNVTIGEILTFTASTLDYHWEAVGDGLTLSDDIIEPAMLVADTDTEKEAQRDRIGAVDRNLEDLSGSLSALQKNAIREKIDAFQLFFAGVAASLPVTTTLAHGDLLWITGTGIDPLPANTFASDIDINTDNPNYITSAEAGDVFSWDTDYAVWLFRARHPDQDVLSELIALDAQFKSALRTSIAASNYRFIGAVANLPSNPANYDVIEFTADISTGLPANTFYEGTTARTTVADNEVFVYNNNNTRWELDSGASRAPRSDAPATGTSTYNKSFGTALPDTHNAGDHFELNAPASLENYTFYASRTAEDSTVMDDFGVSDFGLVNGTLVIAMTVAHQAYWTSLGAGDKIVANSEDSDSVVEFTLSDSPQVGTRNTYTTVHVDPDDFTQTGTLQAGELYHVYAVQVTSEVRGSVFESDGSMWARVYENILETPNYRDDSVTLIKLKQGTPSRIIGYGSDGRPVESGGDYIRTMLSGIIGIQSEGTTPPANPLATDRHILNDNHTLERYTSKLNRTGQIHTATSQFTAGEVVFWSGALIISATAAEAAFFTALGAGDKIVLHPPTGDDIVVSLSGSPTANTFNGRATASAAAENISSITGIVDGDLVDDTAYTIYAIHNDVSVKGSIFESDGVFWQRVYNGLLLGSNLPDDLIVSRMIADGAILNAHIADDAIERRNMADNSVGASEIINASVGHDELANFAVGLENMRPDAVPFGNGWVRLFNSDAGLQTASSSNSNAMSSAANYTKLRFVVRGQWDDQLRSSTEIPKEWFQNNGVTVHTDSAHFGIQWISNTAFRLRYRAGSIRFHQIWGHP